MIHIYTDQPGPRLRFVLNVLFAHWYPMPYRIIQGEPAEDTRPSIYYLQKLPEGTFPGLHIRPGGWLQSHFLPESDVRVRLVEGLPALEPPFKAPHADGWPFDLLGMLFYLLARVEEYRCAERDAHDRFPARASLAHRFHFLEYPLADRWTNRLIASLEERYPGWQCPAPPFRVQPTVDVDYPWAFRYKPWWKQAGAFAKNCLQHPAIARSQWDTWRKHASDPFFTFPYLAGKLRGRGARHFLLMGGDTAYDRGPSTGLAPYRRLIRKLERENQQPGLHPSYDTLRNSVRLQAEKNELETILGRPVQHSRQHYLRLALPHAYRQLLAAGIRHDWSMGYADAVGFRAGTARAFPWYDLEKEQSTELTVHPFACMDVSLRNYLGLSPAESIRKGQDLARAVQQGGGTFTFIWHNSSFSAAHGWAGWTEVFEQLLDPLPSP